MPTPPAVAKPAALPSLRRALLQGVSLGAVMVAAGPGQVAPFRSIHQAARLGGAALIPAPSAGVAAARTAQLGAQNLAAAAARFIYLSHGLAQLPGVSSALAVEGLAFRTPSFAPRLLAGPEPSTRTCVEQRFDRSAITIENLISSATGYGRIRA